MRGRSRTHLAGEISCHDASSRARIHSAFTPSLTDLPALVLIRRARAVAEKQSDDFRLLSTRRLGAAAAAAGILIAR